MHFGPPQIILIVLVILALLISAAMNGEPFKGKFNFGLTLIRSVGTIALLYWGGFFH